MLKIYPSNQTEALAYVIAEIMKRQPLSDPFKNEVIVIQSQGMGAWLQQQIASHLDIAAMIDTPMPATFMWQIAQGISAEFETDQRFEKQCLRWEIFRLLPEKLSDPRYASLRSYLQNAAEKSGSASRAGRDSSSLYRFKLSAQIADCFDAYQNYRPDWIRCWELGESIDPASSSAKQLEAWQRDLWQSLYPQQAVAERRHRAALLGEVRKGLEQQHPNLLQALPERLFVFGISALPPQWLPIILALSKWVDVHFLFQNPCCHYWGDELSEIDNLRLQQSLLAKKISAETAADSFVENNPLLASWGRQGREYLSLLTQAEAEYNHVEFVDDLYLPSSGQCLLHSIQQDILELEINPRPWQVEDDSLQFARCHSPLREVEALHDFILTKLDQHPDLEAKDIVVMMPDVETFAPLIEAVFSRPVTCSDGSETSIPFSISDHNVAMELPMVEVLTSLLNIANTRLSANEVLAWLDVPAIRSHFGIEADQLELIEFWVHSLNVRWGLDAKDREQSLGSDSIKTGLNSTTWLNAFSRILEGYLSGQGMVENGDGQRLENRVLDTADEQILAGNCLHFLDVIRRTKQQFSGSAPVSEWNRRLIRFWQNWFDESSVDEALSKLWYQACQSLVEEIEVVRPDMDVAFSVISNCLINRFSEERISQRFLAGRINFCTLMPMRSIPFRMVCLLGMNEGNYPRPIRQSSYDLMANMPRRAGDRSRRDDDRYLFLEALGSARDWLYISYCGFDARDNSERFPSVLVTELREYCQRLVQLPGGDSGGGTVGEAQASDEEGAAFLASLTQDHRLQPFHPVYFAEDSNQARTYARDWISLHHGEFNLKQASQPENPVIAQAQMELILDESPESRPTEMSLGIIAEALIHPLRLFYRNEIGAAFTYLERPYEEHEPFNYDSLDTFSLKQDLVASWFNPDLDETGVIKSWQARDLLPPEPLQQFGIERVQAELIPFRQNLADTQQCCLQRIQTRCLDGSVTVFGNISRDTDGGVLAVSIGRQHANHFWSAWVQHVFWSLYCAQSAESGFESGEAHLLAGDRCCVFPVLSPETSQKLADELLNWALKAQQEPQVFLSKTAFARLFESEAKARAAYHGGGQFGLRGEIDDQYWQRWCRMSKEDAKHKVMQIPDFNDVAPYCSLLEMEPGQWWQRL